ncbi:MAG: hypothetical protein ACOC2H_06065 [Spirochaetota bacterium]
MIKLKSGRVVEFIDNYDEFFQKLMQEIVNDCVAVAGQQADKAADLNAYNSLLLKELMDNSIYVTHQIFDLAKVNRNLSKFLVTGFLFNSMVMSIPELDPTSDGPGSSDSDIIQ